MRTIKITFSTEEEKAEAVQAAKDAQSASLAKHEAWVANVEDAEVVVE